MTGKTHDIDAKWLYLQTLFAILFFPVFQIFGFGIGTLFKHLCAVGKECAKECGNFGYIIPWTIMLPWSLMLLLLSMILAFVFFLPFLMFTIVRFYSIYSHNNRKGKAPNFYD
jgi:hypothetical protein